MSESSAREAADATSDSEKALGLDWPTTEEWKTALDSAYALALDYLTTLPASTVSHHASPETMSERFNLRLPDTGCAPAEAVCEWFSRAEPGIVRTPSPRYFGFVTGGVTPAALAGDWLASAIDQNPATWLLSPAAAQTELTAIRWLLDLFGLPLSWSGAFTTGATMANLSGLAAARQWASERLGFDASTDGLGGRPAIAVLGSTEVHQSALKALGLLGLGRDSITLIPSRNGAIDLDLFAAQLSRTEGPAIVIANAGEVNTGAFDDIRAVAELCAGHQKGAWLHVDAAFGLYAALAPSHSYLLEGIDLADSVASDAHKWLNVPYDCGIVFVRDSRYSRRAFGGSAAYLSTTGDPQLWNAFEHVPEFSRRFRALSVWCSLRSLGRNGYRSVVERSIRNAHEFATWVEQYPGLELMAPATLNILCFRFLPPDSKTSDGDLINARGIEHIQRSGTAYVSGTRWDGKAAIRAAFDNWATHSRDVDALKLAVSSALRDIAQVSHGEKA